MRNELLKTVDNRTAEENADAHLKRQVMGCEVGAFPVWLAPVQATLIPIAGRHVDYCHLVARQLKAAGLRVEVDDGSDRMANKIRKAQEQKVPYMLVVGDREVESGQVSVRLRSGEDLKGKPVEVFIAMAQKAVAERV